MNTIDSLGNDAARTETPPKPGRRPRCKLLILCMGLWLVLAATVYRNAGAWQSLWAGSASGGLSNQLAVAQLNYGPGQRASGGFNPRVVIRTPFRPITEFPVARAGEVTGKLDDAELVLGVVIGNEARAYPINMLTGPRREIINDVLGGRAIAATW